MFGARRACCKRGVAATCEADRAFGFSGEAAMAGPGSQRCQPIQCVAAGSNPRTTISPPETPYIAVKFRRCLDLMLSPLDLFAERPGAENVRQLTMTFPERRTDPKIVLNTRRKHFQNCDFPHSAAPVVGRQAAASRYTVGALPPRHSHGGDFLCAASAARPNFCRDP